MSSNSKLQKRSDDCKQVIDNRLCKLYEDRLTNLPSELKAQILSCLRTKDAVKTSALSKKWKRSWTCVSNLDFDEGSLYSFGEPSTCNFTNFVNRVLLLHDRSCLQKFRLRRYRSYDEKLINAWIAAVLLSNVQEINLSVSPKCLVFLPSDIFLCETLVLLKLCAGGSVNLPNGVCLPHLKTLRIECLEFPDDGSINNLLSGCPVLEKLRLYMCIGNNVRVINIISLALKKLSLEYLPSREDAFDYEYQIVLDTPALEDLNLNDDFAEEYIIKDVGHPIRAYISNYDRIRDESILNFLKSLTKVRHFDITDSLMDVIYERDIKLPTFNRLESLELGNSEYLRLLLVPILQRTPHIERLEIWGVHCTDPSSESNFLLEDTPCCLLSHLKVLIINSFDGLEDEMEIVGYFLKKALVLEELALHTQFDTGHPISPVDPRKLMMKNILMLPRGSNRCRVSLDARYSDEDFS